MKLPKSDPNDPTWTEIPYFMSVLEQHGMQLGMMIVQTSKKRFLLFALESFEGMSAQLMMGTPSPIVIGDKYRSKESAQKAACAFGKRWTKMVKRAFNERISPPAIVVEGSSISLGSSRIDHLLN